MSGALALAVVAIATAPAPRPAQAAGGVQPVALTIEWDYATGLGDSEYREEIMNPFCFPSYDEALGPDWWYRSSLTMQAGGALTGSCSDNPDYPGSGADSPFSATLTGSLDLSSAHPIEGTSSWGGAINWLLQADELETRKFGTIKRHLTVTADEAEGWFPDRDGAHDVPTGGAGTADYTYSCESDPEGECDDGTALSGTVRWLMHFEPPQEGGGSCAASGYVTDVFGQPVVGVEVGLKAGDHGTTAATDANGYYQFDPVDATTPNFNVTADQIRVSLALREAAHSPARYAVYDRQQDAVILPPGWTIAERPDCRQDFDFRSIPPDTWLTDPPREDWPALVQIYQGIAHAWALADRLGQELEYGLPLEVYAFCNDTSLGCDGTDFAFAVNTTSDGTSVVPEPYIAFGTDTSRLASPGWPDNREYHEFGHYFMAASFGGMPDRESDENHWGYKNTSSTDSWTEGFAEWYSAMVSEYIDARPDYSVYRVGKLYAENLRDANVAWITEEIAVASLLTAVEANPAPAARPTASFEISGYTVTSDPAFGPLLVGSLTNTATRTARAVRIKATAASGAWSRLGFTMPRDVRPGERAIFVMLVPEVIGAAGIGVVAKETEAPPPPAQIVHAPLREMWDTIYRFASQKPGSNGHLFDVEDLFQAFEQRWGGADASSGLDSVERAFVRHGFYDNTAHDGPETFTYEAGETIGVTGHPAFGLDTLGGKACEEYLVCSPARATRTDLTPPPAATATVDLGDVDGVVFIQVDYPSGREEDSFATVGSVGADGTVAVPVPPPSSGAAVTLIALAEGRTPRVLGKIMAEEYWNQVQATAGAPFLAYTARLAAGDLHLPDLSAAGAVPQADERPPGTTAPNLIAPTPGHRGGRGVVISIVVVGAIVAVVIGAIVLSRRRPGAASPPSASGPWPPPHPS